MARTMAILRALTQLGPGEHPLSSVAKIAQLPAPTVHRYLQALVREGAVEQSGPRARYALHSAHRSPAPDRLPMPEVTSPAVKAELVTLQSRTGQIAAIYRPHLIGVPMRICADRACGPHSNELHTAPQSALRALLSAPLEADAAGLAILACLSASSTRSNVSHILAEGHAISPSPLAGRTVIAAPLWYGSAVAGSVALLAGDVQVRRSTTRSRYVTAVMDTAAAMSGQLTRSGTRRAS